MADLAEMKQFWMVHGAGPTNYRHRARYDAVAEADRLARQHPGKVFVVLAAVEAIRKVDLERTSLRPADGPAEARDDIPF